MGNESRFGTTGYSTGTWAAAAAKGAAVALLLGKRPRVVEVNLPSGEEVCLPLGRIVVKSRAASCRVVKRGVERGDATYGVALVATVISTYRPGVRVTGGRGTGLVTKPGLEVPVGERAINPTPRAMIEREVEGVLLSSGKVGGCRVVISVPEGRKIAERTLNPRLGVKRGISILGTSGLVIPYSTEAFLVSVEKSIDVARACGNRAVVLCTGRRSESAARRHLHLPEECFVICGDQFNFALRRCLLLGFQFVSVWAMPGKMAKLATGQMDLHNSEGFADLSMLITFLDPGATVTEGQGVFGSLTGVHALLDSLSESGRKTLSSYLCLSAAIRCWRFLEGSCRVQCNLITRDGELLASACQFIPSGTGAGGGFGETAGRDG